MYQGKIIILTSGAYDDYSILAAVRWISSELPADALKTYLELFPEYNKKYSFNEDAFLDWLIKQEYAEELGSDIIMQLHLGDYGIPPNKNNPDWGK